VEKLKILTDDYVGMCGDGANDCQALRAADIGVSLSSSDASIAAPFTSKIPNISSVETVLKEGKASLSSSVQLFKFMAMYAIIQTISTTILYWFGSMLSEPEFLIVDLFALALGLTLGDSQPSKHLTKERPPQKLFSSQVLKSIYWAAAISAFF